MGWISTEHNGRNRAAFVCECIAMCEQFVKKLSAVCVSCAAAYMVLSVADHIKEKVCSRIAPETLVTLKVRLDD